MSGATPLPRTGEVFFDARGEDRALRLSWYPDSEVMVFSFWNRGVCTGTFRMPSPELPALVETLAQGVPETGGRRHAAPVPEGGPPPAASQPRPPEPQRPFPMTGEYEAPTQP
jgi:hypothetical protein